MTAASSRRSKPPVHPARREGAARSTSSTAAQAAVAEQLDQQLDLPVEPAGPKHLRVAPKVSRRVLSQRRRARWAVFGVAAISAASMFLLVTFHVFAVQSSFQLDKLERERAAEQRENALLRNLVARRSSATTIFNAATELGMVRAPKPTLLNLDLTGTAALPPSATPVSTPEIDYDAIASAP
jgi:hypothetical protein